MSGPFTTKKVEEKNPHDIQEMIDDGHEVVVIDVREPWEYYGDTGHVRNSMHIPMGEIPDKVEKLRTLTGKKIAVICNSGSRSYSVCEYLNELGFDDVYNVRGGIIQWHLSGLDVEYEE